MMCELFRDLRKIRRALEEIRDFLKEKQIAFYVEGRRSSKMDLKDNFTLPVSILLEDKFGNVTGAADAPPAWTVADVTIGSVAVSDDGMSAVFTPAGKLGATQLQVLASVAGKTLAGSMDLNIIAGDATQIVIQPGLPVAAV